MSSIGKNNPDFFKIFLWLVYPKKEKNENGKIRHYSFKMADNDLKIWHNNLLSNPFHMVDAKFDLFLRPTSLRNPAMPFLPQSPETCDWSFWQSQCRKIKIEIKLSWMFWYLYLEIVKLMTGMILRFFEFLMQIQGVRYSDTRIWNYETCDRKFSVFWLNWI